LGQVSRRSDGSNAGTRPGGLIARMPLSPSTITARASPRVAPISAIRKPGSASASSRTHSAPARVLPKPRPAMISQVRQLPAGACCALRPWMRQT
jgi:hypothetical protein